MDVAARRKAGENRSYRAEQQINGKAKHGEGDQAGTYDYLQGVPQLEPHYAGHNDSGAGRHHYRCGNDA
jgi:hypothetical protein